MHQIKLNEKSNIATYELKSFFRGSLLSYLVGFYIFAFYLELHFRISSLEAIRFQFIYGAFVGGLCFISFLKSSAKHEKLSSVTKTVFLFLLIMGIYTIFSLDRPVSIPIYIDRVIKFALVAFFIYTATNKVEDLRVIVAFMLLAWLKIGQEGFWGWYTGNLVWENQGIPRLHGSTTMYAHPNSYSGFAVGCLPYAIFLLMCVRSNLLRLGLLMLFCFSLLIVVNTGSRTGYVAVLLGSVFFFLKLKKGKFKIILLALLTFSLAATFVPEHYKERFFSIFTGEEKEGASSKKRIEIINDAVEVYKAYPLGVGIQAFPKVRDEMFGRTQDTHNLYLEILTNLGPAGLIVFGIFINQLIRLNKQNIAALRQEPESVDQGFLLALCKATIGFICVRLLLGLFGMDLYEIYWWVALGFTLAITKLSNRMLRERQENNTLVVVSK